MRRATATAPSLLLLVAVLLMPALVLAAGETKTFEEHNFKITAPSESWQWLPVNDELKQNGYAAALGRRTEDSVAIVHLRTQPQTDPPLTLAEFTDEVLSGLSAQIGGVEGTRKDEGMLSGLKGTLVLVKGKNDQNQPVLIRAYTILAGNRFHQMIQILANGAETKQAKELDALRRGYRLLEGAGPQEPAADLPDEGAGPHGGGSGQAPAQEGRTLSFPSQNLKWTIPEGSPFKWVFVADDEGATGRKATAEARIELDPPTEKPRPGEPEPPTHNIARITLSIYPPQEGWTPSGFVNSPALKSNIEENVFDRVDYGRTQTKDDVPIGNVEGSALQMVGAKEGQVVYLRVYGVLLKGKIYVWEAVMAGDRMVDNDLQRPLNDLVKGIEFLDTTEWVRGPLAIPGVAPFSGERGRGLGEETEITSLGFTAEKPEEMAEVDFDAQSSGGNLRVAWEARTEDKQHYLYFDVQTFTEKSLREGGVELEDIIQQRENLWKENAGSAETIARGREPWYRDRFGRGKGLGYEFTGYLGDIPFVEKGYVVEYKDYVYWIRVQLGGKDAEKLFKKLLKALDRAVKMG